MGSPLLGIDVSLKKGELILNAIDGLKNNHGMILIMTTNHPEHLDKALIRDGRIDERLLFDYCDHEQIFKMFRNFYNGNLEVEYKDIQELDITTRKLAPCNVENAMKKHYKDSTKAYQYLVEYDPMPDLAHK